MNIKGLLLGIFMCMMASLPSQGQDIHFSQFYASPLTLNPAMTGLMDGCYRASVNYRNQYPELYSYSTVAASFDMPLLRAQLRNDFAGAGLMIFNDRQGNGALNNLSIMGSVAGHKSLHPDGKVLLSIGVQGGWVNKSVDFQSLLFESQLDGTEFNPNLPNQERIDDNQFGYFDLRAGLMLSANVSKTVGFFGGASYFHITEPEETFLIKDDNLEVNTLSARLVGHLGAKITPNNQVSITPNFIYMTQAGATTMVFGANLGYYFDGTAKSGSNGTALYVGASYRLNDAVIALIGAEFNSFKFGISYDINISELRTASSGQGGIELSLGYELDCEPQGRRGYPPISCPRF